MNDQNYKISVIVISFNGLAFIHDCLETVRLSLETTDAEIIVVDNGSTDGTLELIKDKFPDVNLVENKKNLGFARAANQGFDKAQGQYILLLNQDTRIRNYAIAKLAGKMQSDPKIGTIGPKFIGFDGRLQKACRSFPRYRDFLYIITGLSTLFPESKIFSHWKMGWFDHLSEREVDQPMGAALMIRRSLLEELGGFDERFRIFFNDVDFCRRAKSSGYISLYYPSAVIEHYYGGTIRTMKSKMILEWHRALSKYFIKHSRSRGAKLIARLMAVLIILLSYPRAVYHWLYDK